MKPLPPIETLRDLFALDPSSPSHLAHKPSMEPAGRMQVRGYWRLYIGGTRYAVHRIVWSLANGRLVDDGMQIDHINGDRGDNRPSNLRICTNAENAQNSRYRAKGLPRGTGYVASSGRWRANIYVNYKKCHVGYFDTEQEAHEAYLRAKAQLHPFWAKKED